MKKTISMLTFTAMLLSVTACGSDDKTASTAEVKTEIITEAPTKPPTTEPPFDTEGFKKRIAEFDETICDACTLLANIIKYEANDIEISHNFGDTPDSSKMYENAVDWLIEKATPEMEMTETKIEDDYSAICKEYQDIKAADNGTQELSAIREAYEELFDGYTIMYMTATSPSTSSSVFASQSRDGMDKTESADNRLKAYLK